MIIIQRILNDKTKNIMFDLFSFYVIDMWEAEHTRWKFLENSCETPWESPIVWCDYADMTYKMSGEFPYLHSGY